MVNRKDVLDKVEVVYEKAMKLDDVKIALDALKFMYDVRMVMPGTLDSPEEN